MLCLSLFRKYDLLYGHPSQLHPLLEWLPPLVDLVIMEMVQENGHHPRNPPKGLRLDDLQKNPRHLEEDPPECHLVEVEDLLDVLEEMVMGMEMVMEMIVVQKRKRKKRVNQRRKKSMVHLNGEESLDLADDASGLEGTEDLEDTGEKEERKENLETLVLFTPCIVIL